MAYGDFKDLARRTASDKVLRNKAFNIAKNIKYDKFFDQKSASPAGKERHIYKQKCEEHLKITNN